MPHSFRKLNKKRQLSLSVGYGVYRLSVASNVPAYDSSQHKGHLRPPLPRCIPSRRLSQKLLHRMSKIKFPCCVRTRRDGGGASFAFGPLSKHPVIYLLGISNLHSARISKLEIHRYRSGGSGVLHTQTSHPLSMQSDLAITRRKNRCQAPTSAQPSAPFLQLPNSGKTKIL